MAQQSSTIDISESGRLITSMITSMSEFRDQPSSWTDIWDDVLKLCSTHDITIQVRTFKLASVRKRFENRQTTITPPVLAIEKKS